MGVKISELPAAAAIVGDELVEAVQSGANVQTTPAGIVAPHVADADPHTQYALEADLALQSLENMDSVTLPRGTPVAIPGTGVGMIRAQADAPATAAIGLLDEDTDPGMSGGVSCGGQFTLADWTDITGAATLAALGVYFLDPSTPGMLTLTPPTTVGQIAQIVGRAFSPTCLDLDPTPPILL